MSDFGKAVRYMLERWDGPARFLTDPRIPLDNNAAYAVRSISGRMPRARICRVGERIVAEGAIVLNEIA